MIRFPAFVLVGCVVCAGLILVELGSIGSRRASPGVHLAPATSETEKLASPLPRPAPRRPATASSAKDADSPLRDVRLTGVVIGPDLRIAIFAVSGANPRLLSPGDMLKGWRLDSISPQKVVFSGPTGSLALAPQPDAALVRPPPPVAAPPSLPAAATADAPAPSMIVSPIAVVTASTTAPAQPQGLPYYVPEYSPGDDPFSPWAWGSPWSWGWPVAVSVGFRGCRNCGFHNGFFRPGFHRFGFAHPAFHPGVPRSGFAHASFAGGFRGGARR